MSRGFIPFDLTATTTTTAAPTTFHVLYTVYPNLTRREKRNPDYCHRCCLKTTSRQGIYDGKIWVYNPIRFAYWAAFFFSRIVIFLLALLFYRKEKRERGARKRTKRDGKCCFHRRPISNHECFFFNLRSWYSGIGVSLYVCMYVGLGWNEKFYVYVYLVVGFVGDLVDDDEQRKEE